ncbi:MAG: hypothetical protein NWE87_00810 [Candidatus Bathyarchaeota archaeon]|nr:hypothetical protein [Candidatus Bathyarchaeota archaeon]
MSVVAVLTALKKIVGRGGRMDPNFNIVTLCPRAARDLINTFAITFFHVFAPFLT